MGLLNIPFIGVRARRIPIISIHNGVVILPRRVTISLTCEGSFTPKINRGIATARANTCGFKTIFFTLMYFLSLEITPKTVIHVLNFYNDRDDNFDEWYQIYAGPLTMYFDHTVLKDRRKKMGYSQEEVALAIDTTVRTYQKWESGETTPNGHYLMRLMNWLDIPDVQYVIQYTDCE